MHGMENHSSESMYKPESIFVSYLSFTSKECYLPGLGRAKIHVCREEGENLACTWKYESPDCMENSPKNVMAEGALEKSCELVLLSS